MIVSAYVAAGFLLVKVVCEIISCASSSVELLVQYKFSTSVSSRFFSTRVGELTSTLLLSRLPRSLLYKFELVFRVHRDLIRILSKQFLSLRA